MLNKNLVDKIKKVLEEQYFEKDQYGKYYLQVLADYKDSLSEDTIKEIINSDNPIEEFYSLFDEWDFYYEYKYLYEQIKIKLGKETYEKYEDEIIDWVCENLYFVAPYEHYEQQEVLVNIIVDVGDGNYDYTCNNFLNYYAPDIEELVIPKESSILWLVKQQGYTEQDLLDVINSRYDKKNKFLDSLNAELLNSCTSINALTFSVRMKLRELIDLLETPKDIVLDRSTSCGLVDFWQGSGSLLNIRLENDVVIPKKYARVTVDGTVGYSVQEIYGMCPSFWTETILVA